MEKMENIKSKLNKMILKNIDNLSDNKIVQLSQILDKFILIEQKKLIQKNSKRD